MVRIIGDVHGQIEDYLKFLPENGTSIQVGDMGIGFPNVDLPKLTGHKFFRGNHDNPEMCQEHPNYMGDFGYDPDNGLFWWGGAFSIDYTVRTAHVDWWPNEELKYADSCNALNAYETAKPRIMLSHDCPASVATELFGFSDKTNNNTAMWLQEAVQTHQPDIWIFGHYHQHVEATINGTKFVCLGAPTRNGGKWVGGIDYIDIE